MTAALALPQFTGGSVTTAPDGTKAQQPAPMVITARTLEAARQLHHKLAQNALAVAILRDNRSPRLQGAPSVVPFSNRARAVGSTLAYEELRLVEEMNLVGQDGLVAREAHEKAQEALDAFDALNHPPHPLSDARLTWSKERTRLLRAIDRAQAEVTRQWRSITALSADLKRTRADLARIETGPVRRAGHERLYRVTVPAVQFVHPLGYLIAQAPELNLTVDVAPDACVQVEGTWYSIGEYRGNDTHPGVKYKGGEYPLWAPHVRDGLQRPNDARPQHAALIAALLTVHHKALEDALQDGRDLKMNSE